MTKMGHVTDHIKDNFYVEARDIKVTNLVSASSRDDIPSNWETFHSYPKRCGWEFDHDYQIHLGESPCPSESLASFLQSWLFYGLVFTVVQKNQEPILDFKALNNPGNNAPGTLTTQKLANALLKWKEWERGNPSGRNLRMVRAEKVLDIARRVVRRRFSCEGDYLGQQVSDDKLHVTDEFALVLMTLGETLSAAKSKIMRETKSELHGWHYDHTEGWGQPRFVILKMRENKWCPRTIHIWRNQFQSNATLLLAAYYAYKDVSLIKGEEHTKRTEERPPCTKDTCNVISATDDSGQYHSRHLSGSHYVTPCLEECGEPLGPDMELVETHLRKDNTPLLQFYNEDETDVRLEVIAWSPNSPKYATISHVWSDGFGNEKENRIPKCQLRYIKRQLALLGGYNTFW